MGLTVFYVPRTKISSAAMWETLRSWQKTAHVAWERLRVTPDFYEAQSLKRDEMAAMLDLVRLKQVDRVVYGALEPGQAENLDWLAFVYSLKRNEVPVESLGGDIAQLERQLEALTQGFTQLDHKSKRQPAKLKPSL